MAISGLCRIVVSPPSGFLFNAVVVNRARMTLPVRAYFPYIFRVATLNSKGMSSFARSPEVLTAKSPPDSPQEVIVQNMTRHLVDLTWEPPEDNGGDDIERSH